MKVGVNGAAKTTALECIEGLRRYDSGSITVLITCYVVPLLLFLLMGGIFTSITPESKDTLIPSMTVMGVSMGALAGMPTSLVELYGSDLKKCIGPTEYHCTSGCCRSSYPRSFI